MNLLAIKYHTCELDQGEGILLVDVESETIPRTNTCGHRLYYCTRKQHFFSVDEHGNVIKKEYRERLLPG